MVGRSPGETRGMVGCCRRSTVSEAQRAFGAARWVNAEVHYWRSPDGRGSSERHHIQGREPEEPRRIGLLQTSVEGGGILYPTNIIKNRIEIYLIEV